MDPLHADTDYWEKGPALRAFPAQAGGWARQEATWYLGLQEGERSFQLRGDHFWKMFHIRGDVWVGPWKTT